MANNNHIFRKLLLTLSISTIFLFGVLSKVSADDGEVVIDYIAVNNVVVEGENITVEKDDVVKIAGRGITGDQISVLVNENKYETEVDATGNWFVLFSIGSEEKKNFAVKLLSSDLDDSKDIAWLQVKGSVDEEVQTGDDVQKSKAIPMYLLVIPLLLILVPVLLFNRKGERRVDEDAK